MKKNLADAQDIFLGKVNQICSKFGLNNIMAQLYALLYLSKHPLSLDDMAERLKISKGSASINIRAVERYGAVRRVWVKGSRKDYYEAETDIVKVIMDRITSMAQRRISEIDEMLKSSYKILNSVNSSNKEEEEAINVFKERLDKLKELHSQAQSLFDLFNSGLLDNIINSKLIEGKEKSINVAPLD